MIINYNEEVFDTDLIIDITDVKQGGLYPFIMFSFDVPLKTRVVELKTQVSDESDEIDRMYTDIKEDRKLIIKEWMKDREALLFNMEYDLNKYCS